MFEIVSLLAVFALFAFIPKMIIVVVTELDMFLSEIVNDVKNFLWLKKAEHKVRARRMKLK